MSGPAVDETQLALSGIRRLLIAILAACHPIGAALIAAPLILSDEPDGSATRWLIAAAVSVILLSAGGFWLLAALDTSGGWDRRVPAVLVAEQVALTGAACLIGGAHTNAATTAATVPVIAGAAFVGGTFAALLASVNAVGLIGAYAAAPELGLVIAQSAPSDGWPIFVILGFVYPMPAYLISALVSRVEQERVAAGTRAQRQGERILQAMQASVTASREMHLLHTRVMGALDELYLTLRTSDDGRGRDFAADARVLSLEIRDRLPDLPQRPGPRRP